MGQQKSGILSLQDRINMSFPKKLFQKNRKQFPIPEETLLTSSINVFVINKNGRLYLVDSGLGGTGKGLSFLLGKLDVKKEKIHAVLLTHAHPDHIGGLVDEKGKKVYPNAKIYLSKTEYDAHCSPKSPLYHPFMVLRKAYGKMITTFKAGEKVENIFQSHEAFGHTPGHTVFEYGKLLFIGDLLHSAQLQFSDPEICAVYDMDQAQAVRSRKKILSYAAKKNLLVAGAHIPFPGTGKVTKEEKGFAFVPAKE